MSAAQDHDTDGLYRLYAHIGSPYSMKMRALLRYRRIPHVVMSGIKQWEHAFRQIPVRVMPVLEYPDGSFQNTPRHPSSTKRNA